MKAIAPNGRYIFYYNDVDEIRAGGMIFYRFNKKLEFLMIKVDGRYEDFGGIIDAVDNTIYDTVAREADEESNNVIDKKYIYDSIYKSLEKYSNVNLDPNREMTDSEIERELDAITGSGTGSDNNLANETYEVFSKPSKYIVYLIPTDKDYESHEFGTMEFHDRIYRTVEWVDYETLLKSKINFRLKHKLFYDTLKKIYVNTNKDKYT